MKRIVITYLLILLCPTLLFGQDESIQEQDAQNYHRIGIVVMPHTAWQYADLSSFPFGNTQMYTLGLSYERKIAKRIGFEADLLYSYYIGHLICDSVIWIDFNTYRCFGSQKENLHFIRIPLILQLYIINKGNVTMNISAGVQPGVLVKSWSKIDTERNNYPKYYVASFMAGIGAEYKLSEKYSLKGQIRIENAGSGAIALGLLIGVSYNL